MKQKVDAFSSNKLSSHQWLANGNLYDDIDMKLSQDGIMKLMRLKGLTGDRSCDGCINRIHSRNDRLQIQKR